MITRVRVKNFRSLADVDVTLGPLTVLIGKNGSGKSAFLDALAFVRDALMPGGLPQAISSRNGLASILYKHEQEVAQYLAFEITLEEEDWAIQYGFKLALETDGHPKIMSEHLSKRNLANNWEPLYRVREGKWEKRLSDDFMGIPTERVIVSVDSDKLVLPSLSFGHDDSAHTYNQLCDFVLYKFDVDAMRPPRKIDFFSLTPTGNNLTSVLLQFQKLGTLILIVSSLRAALPEIESIEVRPLGSEYVVAYVQYRRENGERTEFELAQESDGMLRLLALLTAINHHNAFTPISLTAIEEPEMMLYPDVLEALSESIQEAAHHEIIIQQPPDRKTGEKPPDAVFRNQILLTTHSPDLISTFPVDQLRVVEKVNGATYIGPIDEARRQSLNQQLFTTGDLLRIGSLHTDAVPLAEAHDG